LIQMGDWYEAFCVDTEYLDITGVKTNVAMDTVTTYATFGRETSCQLTEAG